MPTPHPIHRIPLLSSLRQAGVRNIRYVWTRLAKHKWFYFGLILWLLPATGCAIWSKKPAGEGTAAEVRQVLKPDTDKVVIYVYRDANYQGGGRTHLLQLDTYTLGRLNNDNYFCIEFWPGNYYLNIHLPSETFLGETSTPMSVGRLLDFTHRDAGKAYIYTCVDGAGIQQQDATRQQLAVLMQKRVLTRTLNADATAHVKEFFDTPYEGPEMNGRPHGKGVLIWPDGSRYEGVFHHGQLTHEGRFYFPDGRIYMGRLAKGRPMGSGVLMTPEGRILYAGPFISEKPHGTGLRRAEAGPEYCTYEAGEDVTLSLSYLAEVEVGAQDHREVARFFEYCPYSLTIEADTAFLAAYQSAYQEVLDLLSSTRPFRLSGAYQKLKADHQARINAERVWCNEKFTHGRHWCLCAPFDNQAGQWEECVW